MEPYTLGRNFQKLDIVDLYTSMIWTERYYGDSEVEIVVPLTSETLDLLPVGVLLGLEGSDEIMILETQSIDKGDIKLTGKSLLPWFNNRFIRTTAKHEDKYWYISGQPPGRALWTIIYNMCVVGSPYLTGATPIGITNPQRLAIPGLGLRDYDNSGANVDLAVPYGPVFDAMHDIATTYEIGMQITLDSVTDTAYSLGFRSYRGLDRSSDQIINAPVRFSPQMDSLTDVKELRSIAAFKTVVYSFAPENPNGLATGLAPGVSSLDDVNYTGFDLRAELLFADDISTDQVGNSKPNLTKILNSRAQDELTTNRYIKTVDGEIVPTSQFEYGTDYNLGDIIEVEGNTGIVQTARITEYIRSEDNNGEKSYPTLEMID